MNKTINITYWITTVLFAASFLFGAYSELTRDAGSIAVTQLLGYPMYLLTILGVAKILGAIGILQRFSPTLREWAYAGNTIDILGAIFSMIAIHASPAMNIPAYISLVVLGLSYYTMKRREGVKTVMVA